MTDEIREERVRRHLARTGKTLRVTHAEWPDYDTLGLYSIFDADAGEFVAKGIKTLDALEDQVFGPAPRSGG
jgi:hypothetical protein